MGSFGLAIRAIVMLACLAVVPLVAMYGKYAPDFVQAVMEAYKARTHTNAEADSREAGGEAPPFSGSRRTDNSANTAGSQSADSSSPWNVQGPTARPLPESATSPSNDDGGLKRASFNAPLRDRNGDRGTAANTGDTPASAAPASSGAEHDRSSDAATGSGEDCTIQFRRMEQRLRELGATYYLLETWGSSGDRYRFFCKMAISGTADYNRNRIFQATATDPLHAMQDVLEQVEQWRAGRQP